MANKKYKQLYTYNEQEITSKSKKWKINLLYQIERQTWRGRLGSSHVAGQVGTKSKYDESQNATNGDENVKYSV